MKYRVRLTIAEIIIEMRSSSPYIESLVDLEKFTFATAYKRFIYGGKRPTDIVVNVSVSEQLPAMPGGRPFFVTNHFLDKVENWRFYRRPDGYVFVSVMPDKRQHIQVNARFDRVQACVAPSEVLARGFIMASVRKRYGHQLWSISDLVYDFLHVLMINYLALHRTGVFAHAVGIDAGKSSGYLFCGRSGAGKSTTARLWTRNGGRARVLNDDRIIVRRLGGRYVMYSSPWVGTFGEYLSHVPASVTLSTIFFLEQSRKNLAEKTSRAESFSHFFSAIFPAFWNKRFLKTTAQFILEMVSAVPCYRLGFVKDASAVDFVRRLARK